MLENAKQGRGMAGREKVYIKQTLEDIAGDGKAKTQEQTIIFIHNPSMVAIQQQCNISRPFHI